MWTYLAKRTLYMLPILLAVTFVVFLLLYLVPGTFAETLCGLGCPSVTRDRLYEHFGLNDPFHLQYSRWIYGLIGSPVVDLERFPFLHFNPPDFGYSHQANTSAFEALLGGDRAFWSMAVLLSAMALSWLIALPLGVYTATRKGRASDLVVTSLALVGISVPGFIFGLAILWFVQVHLGLGHTPFFQIGYGGFLNPEYVGKPLDLMAVLNFLWHFLPPVVVLALGHAAVVLMHTRGRLPAVLPPTYLTAARAKGLKEGRVIRHALRNALTPLIGMLGFWLPYMMEGALVVALVFNLPVVERAFVQSIIDQNTVVTITGLFLFTLLLLLGNLVSDLLLALNDPRIRYE